MYELGFEEAEELEMKLTTFTGSLRKQGSFRQIAASASLTMLKPLTVWSTTNCGKILKEIGIPGHLTCLLRNLYAGQEATVKKEEMNNPRVSRRNEILKIRAENAKETKETIAKINKAKSFFFFEKINKIDKLNRQDLLRKKGRRAKLKKLEMKMERS